MPASARCSLSLAHFFYTLRQVLADLGRFMFLFSRPRVALAAENLFLRKQLALFQERKVRPRRAEDSTRWVMATLEPSVPVARCAGECEARHAHPMASQGIPSVLALEVETGGTAAVAQGSPRVDPEDGR